MPVMCKHYLLDEDLGRGPCLLCGDLSTIPQQTGGCWRCSITAAKPFRGHGSMHTFYIIIVPIYSGLHSLNPGASNTGIPMALGGSYSQNWVTVALAFWCCIFLSSTYMQPIAAYDYCSS